MAYYQRWQRDLSGGGRYDIQYWPDSDENDSFFIFAPIIALIKGIFKLPIFRNLLGFIVGLPIVLFVIVMGLVLFIAIMILAKMEDCWEKIAKTYFNDITCFVKWAYKKIFIKNKYAQPTA